MGYITVLAVLVVFGAIVETVFTMPGVAAKDRAALQKMKGNFFEIL